MHVQKQNLLKIPNDLLHISTIFMKTYIQYNIAIFKLWACLYAYYMQKIIAKWAFQAQNLSNHSMHEN